MLMAGIDIGPQKPSLIDIRQNAAAKMNIEDQPTFYMGKEIKYQTGQKVSRSHLSRASVSCSHRERPHLSITPWILPLRFPQPLRMKLRCSHECGPQSFTNQYLPPAFPFTIPSSCAEGMM